MKSINIHTNAAGQLVRKGARNEPLSVRQIAADCIRLVTVDLRVFAVLACVFACIEIVIAQVVPRLSELVNFDPTSTADRWRIVVYVASFTGVQIFIGTWAHVCTIRASMEVMRKKAAPIGATLMYPFREGRQALFDAFCWRMRLFVEFGVLAAISFFVLTSVLVLTMARPPVSAVDSPVILGLFIALAFAWLTMRRAKFLLLVASVAYAENQTFQKSSESVNELSRTGSWWIGLAGGGLCVLRIFVPNASLFFEMVLGLIGAVAFVHLSHAPAKAKIPKRASLLSQALIVLGLLIPSIALLVYRF